MTTDVAASIRARLLSKAKGEGTEFQLFLDRFACERFLYRLGKSSVRERCILKGATLLALWMEEPYRATRDVDLLAFGSNDEATVRAMIQEVCEVPCPEDGLIFDLKTLVITEIMDNEQYAGQRARFRALLGKARLTIQLDFGFGDAVTPEPEEQELPTLIAQLPAPKVRAYSRTTALAEKFEAMVKLGMGNSRMKDFHDVCALSEAFAFDGAELRESVANCFQRRGTVWSDELPVALTTAFYTNADRQARWNAYGQSGALLTVLPQAFETIGTRIQAFLGPVRDSILVGEPFDKQWPAGGPWRHRTMATEQKER